MYVELYECWDARWPKIGGWKVWIQIGNSSTYKQALMRKWHFEKIFAKHAANLLFCNGHISDKSHPLFFWSGGIFLTPSISVCYDRNTVCVGWVVVIFWNSWSTTAKWTWVEKQSSNAFQGPQSYIATSATAETHARTCECVWNSSMYIRCFEILLFVFLKKKNT